MTNQGVLFIAYGEEYQANVRTAIATLHRHSPGVAVAVITDRDWAESPRPDLVLIRPKVMGVLSKPTYMGDSPFDGTLFLDADTVVARDISTIFNLLQYYDIGVHFYGAQLNEPGIEMHSQCNSGVLLYRKSDGLREVFGEWLERYKAACVAAGYTGKGHGPVEQRHLAIAIARSRLRPVHLGAYLNFWVHSYAVLSSPPAIVHGHDRHLGGIGPQLGVETTWRSRGDWKERLWLPNAMGLMPAGLRRSDPFLAISLLVRHFINGWKRRRAASRVPR